MSFEELRKERLERLLKRLPADMSKEARKAAEADLRALSESEEYVSLDARLSVDTAKCVHKSAYLDEPRHWVCPECGFGRYGTLIGK